MTTTELDTHGLSENGYRVYLDRYARKDIRRESIQDGDLVLACLDLQTGHREVGRIVQRDAQTVVVEFGFNGSRTHETFAYERVDKPVELRPSETLDRVARAIASVEKDPERWAGEFSDLLRTFTPAGRILAGAGVEEQLTCFNCFVLDYPDDSLQGIYGRCLDMVQTMRRGGGVGIPLSRLRPQGSYVRTVNGRSSGAVGWSAIYSASTGLIEQGGSRRGALMLILDDWHPDVETFINSKRNPNFNVNCNQSIAISDRFMEAVDKDRDWELVFPDTKHPDYRDNWDGDIERWRAQHPDAIVVYKTMKARDLWRQITESAHASAEPGLWFKDRANRASNSYYYDEGRIICTNPCGEQSLPAWAVCNLGHLILPRFVNGPVGEASIDWDGLGWATRTAVRFLDNVVDYTHYFDERNERQQKGERRVGLGTLGLAELMIRCGVRYGANPDCMLFIDKLYSFIAEQAYAASTELAVEKGSFPWFDAEKLTHSGFMQSMPERTRQLVRERGLRNVTLLTQAPCGTVSVMLGTSSGIEPFFALENHRKSRVGDFVEHVAVVDEWRLEQHAAILGGELPDFFVTAQEMTPADHAHTQAAIQRWVDSSISKTSNLPNDYTAEQVGEYYRLMYDLGCKGGTVYRAGSRALEILTVTAPPPAAAPVPTPSPAVMELPDELDSRKIKISTPLGNAHVSVSYLDNEPVEAFAQIGKAGADIMADMEAANRLISLVLRLDSPVPRIERLRLIVEQLADIGGRETAGFGPQKTRSVPDGLAKALDRARTFLMDRTVVAGGAAELAVRALELVRPAVPPPPPHKHSHAVDLCPRCGCASFESSEGCHKCTNCGYSVC